MCDQIVKRAPGHRAPLPLLGQPSFGEPEPQPRAAHLGLPCQDEERQGGGLGSQSHSAADGVGSSLGRATTPARVGRWAGLRGLPERSRRLHRPGSSPNSQLPLTLGRACLKVRMFARHGREPLGVHVSTCAQWRVLIPQGKASV